MNKNVMRTFRIVKELMTINFTPFSPKFSTQFSLSGMYLDSEFIGQLVHTWWVWEAEGGPIPHFGG